MANSVFGSTHRLAKDSLLSVRNIFCVGRNYVDHAKELGNAVPTSPLIFCKTTHALAEAAGRLLLPKDKSNIHHEVEIVLYIEKDHVPGQPFQESVGGIALGLDLTDRDMQSKLKAAGQPWELAKGFPSSAVITDFHQVVDWDALADTSFTLKKNGNVAQTGVARDMLFSWQVLLDYIAQQFTLKAHDIVYTGTPAGVGALSAGDKLELIFDGDTWGTCIVEPKL